VDQAAYPAGPPTLAILPLLCCRVGLTDCPKRALSPFFSLSPLLRDPSLLVRSSAVREGCIVVTLDVMQLAGILSSVQQQQEREKRCAPGHQDGEADPDEHLRYNMPA
jgi:hypothetical protein